MSMALEHELGRWIEELSIPNPAFNNLPPCPFAKKAWIDNKVKVHTVDTLPLILPQQLGDYEIIIMGMSPSLLTPEELTNIVETENKTLKQKGLIALEDHPDDEEIINGWSANNKKFALVFIQSLDKLNKARQSLKDKGYYKHWSNEYYEDVCLR